MPEQFPDRRLQALQQRVADLERAAGVDPFARGVMTGKLSFTAGETKAINHRLGRTPAGFLVVYADAPPQLYFAGDPTATAMRVTSVGAGAYQLWVF